MRPMPAGCNALDSAAPAARDLTARRPCPPALPRVPAGQWQGGAAVPGSTSRQGTSRYGSTWTRRHSMTPMTRPSMPQPRPVEPAPRQPTANSCAPASARRDALAYGPTRDRDARPVSPRREPGAPVAVFIHGGAWRGNNARDSAYGAETFVRAGAHFVGARFRQCDRDRRRPHADDRRRCAAASPGR